MKYLLGTSILIMALFTGCSETKKEETKVQSQVVENKTAMPIVQSAEQNVENETINKVADDLKEKTSKAIDTAAQMAKELSEESKVIVKDIKEESTKVITKIAKETKEITTAAVETINEVKKDLDVKMDEVIQTQEVVQNQEMMPTQETMIETTENATEAVTEEVTEDVLSKEEITTAEGLYLKCAGCHGQKAERSALNKSQIIQDWDKQQIIDSLNGYKDGTYGGAFKGLMLGQVSTLTQEQIEILAGYISTLK